MASEELQKGIESIYGLEVVGERFDLELTEKLLELLGNPHKKYRTVQVTGTNGKGSVSRYLQALLQTGETKVALYTSPHIFTYNERFDINGKPISDKKLGRLIGEIKSVCAENEIQPTFFEFTTALAFLYFANQEVDIAIIEMGLGSPLDSTNCIEPDVSIITNVGIDHTALLGNTVEEIANNKMCVIKEGTKFVTAVTQEFLQKTFKQKCQKLDVPYTHSDEYTEAFVISPSSDGVVRKIRWSGTTIKLQSIAPFQLENMKTALVAAEIVEWPYDVSRLEKVHIVGRHDLFYKECPILVDGAHNELGFAVLADSLQSEIDFSIHNATLIIAISDEGKIPSVEKLGKLFSKIILTQATHKAFDAATLLEKITVDKEKYVVEVDAKKALKLARETYPGAIVVTGSLYMIPDVLCELQKEE